jgi:hypothetical protein
MKFTIQLVDDAGNLFAGEATLEPVSGNGDIQVPDKNSANDRVSGKVKCPSAIECLWKKEAFKRALSFQDIKTALAEEGYNFPMNTLMMALRSAVFLTRRGARGDYSWTQKYPFKS